MRVLICGGGVIGVAIAYFLSLRGIKAILIERTGVANAASGKSGGFLALDWCDGGPLQSLARRSFALHAALAEELPGDRGYRRLTTLGGFGGGRGGGRHGAAGWISARVTIGRRLGSPETTAQIDPAAFTKGLMRAAEGHGAMLRLGTVTGLLRDGDRVTVLEHLEGDALARARQTADDD